MAVPIALSDREACAETQIVLQPSGKISGQVQTADGQPASGVYLRLLPDGPAGSRLVQLVQHGKTAGPDGRFTFDGGSVPTTTCWRSTWDAGEPTGPTACTRPRSLAVSTAPPPTRIAVGEGTAIEMERPFVLPPPLPTRTFTVAVTCQDGSTPPATMTRAAAIGGTHFAEFEEIGRAWSR